MKRGSVTRAFVCGATAAMFSALIQLSAFALSANIQFSDPSTKVGEEFTVSMHVQGDGAIATTDIALGYDSEKMEFVSGDSASGSGGEISVKSSGSEADVYYSLKFKALQEGTASVQVKSAKLEDGSSQAATISHQGSASVTIAAGAASEAAAAGSAVETPQQSESVPRYPESGLQCRQYRIHRCGRRRCNTHCGHCGSGSGGREGQCERKRKSEAR